MLRKCIINMAGFMLLVPAFSEQSLMFAHDITSIKCNYYIAHSLNDNDNHYRFEFEIGRI